MPKISLEDWSITDTSITPSERKVILDVYTVNPDMNIYLHLPPEERVKRRDEERRNSYRELKKYFGSQIIKKKGSHKSPRGAVVETTFKALKEIEKLLFIGNAFIENIEGAVKKERTPKSKFWCVRAIVGIQIEGILSGTQYYEEHFCLIKALQNELDKKVQEFYDDYEQVYFNSDGRRVRWKLDKIVDIYETDITKSNEFDSDEGVEVYSSLKVRKLKPEYTWDGKE